MAAGHTLPSSLKLLVFLLISASIMLEKAQTRSDNDQKAIQAAASPSTLRITTRMPFADTNLFSVKSRSSEALLDIPGTILCQGHKQF